MVRANDDAALATEPTWGRIPAWFVVDSGSFDACYKPGKASCLSNRLDKKDKDSAKALREAEKMVETYIAEYRFFGVVTITSVTLDALYTADGFHAATNSCLVSGVELELQVGPGKPIHTRDASFVSDWKAWQEELAKKQKKQRSVLMPPMFVKLSWIAF
jgi:hypothetical protein